MSTTRSRRSPKPAPAPPPNEGAELDRLERILLLHLLEHRGQQVRFEASQWTTEFGVFRRFAQEDAGRLKAAIRALEMSRMIYRRTQYVVGYSEPKHVFSLTPSGHRKALECQREDSGLPDPGDAEDDPDAATNSFGAVGSDRVGFSGPDEPAE